MAKKQVEQEGSTTERWESKARSLLMGKKIVNVRYMGDDEAEDMGWHSKCVVIELEDGTLLVPQADDEGNDAGALFVQPKKGEELLPVIPVGIK